MTFECTLFAIREGDEIRHARVRASAYGATMVLCQDALPEKFVEAKTADFYDKQLRKANGGREDMTYGTKLVSTKLLDREDAATVKAAFLEACRDGQRIALEGSPKTVAELDAVLRRKPDMLKRYVEDLAFRVGFDSARWALENGKADEMRATLAIIERPTVAYVG